MLVIGLRRCGKVRQEKLKNRQVRLPVLFNVVLIVFDYLASAKERGRIKACHHCGEEDERGDEDGNQLNHMENYGDSVKK